MGHTHRLGNIWSQALEPREGICLQEHSTSGAEVIRRRTWLISGHLKERKLGEESPAPLVPLWLPTSASMWPQPAGSQSSWEPRDTAGTASSKTDGDEKGGRPSYRQMDNVHEIDGGSGQVDPWFSSWFWQAPPSLVQYPLKHLVSGTLVILSQSFSVHYI